MKSIYQIFSDDTSLFKLKTKTALLLILIMILKLNNDLKIISNSAIQWKIIFNPDPDKQAEQILFSKRKA